MAIRSLVAVPAILGILISAASSGWGATPVPGIVCVPLMNIKTFAAIDDKTILLQLRNGRYKRLDLLVSCPEIMFGGFSFVTHTQELCTTDELRAAAPAHRTCMIKQLIDITSEQALALQKR
jgi:hypothetical protein